MALFCCDVVFQPLQQTGGQPIKSKQPPPCFLHRFEAEASAVSLLEGVNSISSCCVVPH